MKRLLLTLLLTGLVGQMAFAEQSKGKYAIVLQAGAETNEGSARAAHALLYARELAEHGYDVALIFDGAGTGWAQELQKPENPLHEHYVKLHELGMMEEICDYCSESFNVKERLTEQQRKLLSGDYKGHPSIVKWIEKGYTIITL